MPRTLRLELDSQLLRGALAFRYIISYCPCRFDFLCLTLIASTALHFTSGMLQLMMYSSGE